MTDKVRFASVWLGGCSGCHMSFLDIDERILQLVERVDFDRSPINDIKEISGPVDIGLVEGSISTPEEAERIQQVRRECKYLVSIGACATGSACAGP